ncbi:EF-hand domain-containing protein [Limnoglobus roseus]|uniref:EF-hand domain-containing protein n=1 Tax=Limnoglobus roseus TaxID=2598579 RepID=A0A5C1ANU0_9BACT|nr:EF-hand domain-containing protein [Limnoglobus roseus]QEL20245.1 hypothetical protein PX52LOC_07337 [Limnoglobus roseus]
MFSRLALLTLSTLLLIATADGADKKKKKKADDSKTDPEKILKQLDGDNDGMLSLYEFNFLPNVMAGAEKATPVSLAATFAKLDTNNNKKLTLDEFKKIKDVGLVKVPAAGKKAKKKKVV